MKKKFILYFILINFVSQHLQAREFNYDVYGLNFPFMKVQFSYSELNKVITKLDSKGLLGFFSYFKGEGSSENLSDQFIYNFSNSNEADYMKYYREYNNIKCTLSIL